MGHNREDDADHDANQRHDVSDAKRHFLSPFSAISAMLPLTEISVTGLLRSQRLAL
jgi:hypothetical protein